VFVRAGHPLTRKQKITLDDLINANWILPAPRTPTRALFDKSFRQISARVPRITVETSDLLVLRGLLLNSDLITVVSPQQLDFEAKIGQVQPLDFELPQTARIIALTQRTKSNPSPGAQLLIEAIREVVSELRDKPAP
jgi:LysR family transcriptional regulator of gallate degradation